MKLLIPTLTAFALLAGVAGYAADEKKAEKPKSYPLKNCVVSDEKLGEMGDPYVFVHEGREVKLCCEGCLKKFKGDSAKYLKKMAAADKKTDQK